MPEPKNNLLRIEKLHLENFRCFEDAEFEFAPEFTLVVGDNGSGKTALLDAAAIPLAQSLSGLMECSGLAGDDVRTLRRTDEAAAFRLERQHPCVVTAQCWLSGERLSDWQSMTLDGHTRTYGDIAARATRLWEASANGGDEALPLIGYYRSARAWPYGVGQLEEDLTPGPRTDAYQGCLEPTSLGPGFLRWFRAMDYVEYREKKADPAFTAAKAAVAGCLPGVTAIGYEPRYSEIIAEMNDGSGLPFRLLSDGYRGMLAMVADLAVRCARLNPAFGEEAASRTAGLVLIDELDLHLHPKWQRRVVEDLRRSFPLVQFIATSHSPFIIQSMRQNEVLRLPDSTPMRRHPTDMQEIAEDVMGLEDADRGVRQEAMEASAEGFFSALPPRDVAAPLEQRERLAGQLGQLLDLYADDPAYCALLRAEAAVRGVTAKGGTE